ncbi:ABC transporter substrate-binding protein [Limnohabitans sp. Rim8]|uniref:ABC transporter substrate-binding protein n=1 Tax=Limnohabitans sp. Rim8 TaxID=1100718 RepID=UPI003305AC17
MKSFRDLVSALFFLLLALTVAAQDSKKILRVVPSADISELDPTRGANLISRIYSHMVFDTLYALDKNLAPQPMMLEKRTLSSDGLTYTFTLRSGLKFHDGSPVSSKDVVASINRWMKGTSIGGALNQRTSSLAAVDNLTFKLVLKEKFGLVEFMLAGPGAPIAAIMREEDATRPDNVPLTNPIGSGPFRYVAAERRAGSKVVFERNPDYPSRTEPANGLAGARVVKFDRVEWTIMPDATTAANALATGEIDFLDTVGADLIPFLKKRGITVQARALPTTAFVRFNFQLPPFNDVRARQALALLIDQKDMMPAVAGDDGKWSVCFSYSVCGTVYGTEVGSEPYRKVDVAKAKALLAQAGYKGETLIILGTPQLAPINTMTQILARRLEDAGVKVEIQMTDFPGMLQRINQRNKAVGDGGYHLFAYYAIGASWFHPLTNVSVDLNCEGRSWPGFPCDPAGESLRQKFLAAPTDLARKTAFDEFHKRLWAFLPYVPAGQFDVSNAYRSNVQGVTDDLFLNYWNIEKR